MTLAEQVEVILNGRVEMAQRNDLFREPLCACSAADDPGYEALKTIMGPWHRSPEERLPGARTVISFFLPFTTAVVHSEQESELGSPLWGEAYLEANTLLNEIGRAVSNLLRDEGYEAISIDAAHTCDPEEVQPMWSHSSAAALAGLGSFGINHMLITEKGSAGRFGTVITTAALAPASTSAPDGCLHHMRRMPSVCG